MLNRTCHDSSIADVLEKNAGRQIIFRQLNTELIENNNVSRQYMTKIEAAILCQYYYLNGEKTPIWQVNRNITISKGLKLMETCMLLC